MLLNMLDFAAKNVDAACNNGVHVLEGDLLALVAFIPPPARFQHTLNTLQMVIINGGLAPSMEPLGHNSVLMPLHIRAPNSIVWTIPFLFLEGIQRKQGTTVMLGANPLGVGIPPFPPYAERWQNLA